MKLFHVDFIFILEIEGEGLPAKLKNSGIPTICLISSTLKSFTEIKKIEILFITVQYDFHIGNLTVHMLFSPVG